MQIGAFRKTVSAKQSQQIDERIKRLQVLKRDFAMALNKQVVKEEGMKVIGEVEKLLAKQTDTAEQSWKSLAKKAQHFHDFDLSHKIMRRGRLQVECETLSAQIKDRISSLDTQLLDKLDSRISSEDKAAMKKAKAEAEEF